MPCRLIQFRDDDHALTVCSDLVCRSCPHLRDSLEVEHVPTCDDTLSGESIVVKAFEVRSIRGTDESATMSVLADFFQIASAKRPAVVWDPLATVRFADRMHAPRAWFMNLASVLRHETMLMSRDQYLAWLRLATTNPALLKYCFAELSIYFRNAFGYRYDLFAHEHVPIIEQPGFVGGNDLSPELWAAYRDMAEFAEALEPDIVSRRDVVCAICMPKYIELMLLHDPGARAANTTAEFAKFVVRLFMDFGYLNIGNPIPFCPQPTRTVNGIDEILRACRRTDCRQLAELTAQYFARGTTNDRVPHELKCPSSYGWFFNRRGFMQHDGIMTETVTQLLVERKWTDVVVILAPALRVDQSLRVLLDTCHSGRDDATLVGYAAALVESNLARHVAQTHEPGCVVTRLVNVVVAVNPLRWSTAVQRAARALLERGVGAKDEWKPRATNDACTTRLLASLELAVAVFQANTFEWTDGDRVEFMVSFFEARTKQGSCQMTLHESRKLLGIGLDSTCRMLRAAPAAPRLPGHLRAASSYALQLSAVLNMFNAAREVLDALDACSSQRRKRRKNERLDQGPADPALSLDLKERWTGPASQVLALPLQIPDVQRPLDPDRVNEIVAYQRASLETRGALLFLGDVGTVFVDDGNRMFLVDGQHRVAALRHLVAHATTTTDMKESRVSLLLVRSCGGGVKLTDAFELVNKAVPVPDWIVRGTLQASRRHVINDCMRLFKQRYGAYLSTSAAPRRPNVQVDSIAAALAACAQRHGNEGAFPETAAGLMSYMDFVNARCRALYSDSIISARTEDKAHRRGCKPLYISNDPSYECVIEWLPLFLQNPAPERETEKEKKVDASSKLQHGTAAAGGTPKARREAVWNRYFGERVGVGHCQCCRREITQQSFECGHVVAVAAGGSGGLENLRPVCRACNRSMGTLDMETFKRQTFPEPVTSYCINVHQDDEQTI